MTKDAEDDIVQSFMLSVLLTIRLLTPDPLFRFNETTRGALSDVAGSTFVKASFQKASQSLSTLRIASSDRVPPSKEVPAKPMKKKLGASLPIGSVQTDKVTKRLKLIK